MRQKHYWANGPTDYIITQESAVLTMGGGQRLDLSFANEPSRSIPLMLFAPQAPTRSEWKCDPNEILAIEASFRIMAYPDLRALAPFIDRYGQCRYAEWPGKVRTDEDLKNAADEETRRLATMPASSDFDPYGGYKTPSWQEKPTGFYHLAQRKGFWWLISPEGNPCFYVGLCSAPCLAWEQTPVTGREWLFEWLPAKVAPYSSAWGENQWGIHDGTEYVAFHTASMIRKYGDHWQPKALALTATRLKAWALSGVAKWGGLEGFASTPVLHRWGVKKLVEHPDIFDPAVASAFKESLREQIVKRRDDPLVLGWSLGNEFDEIIKAKEVAQILGMPDTVPAKRAFADFARSSKLGEPPASQLEPLRRFYADRYYDFIYRTVKELDPNHLYFGFWIVPGWWENEEDWRLIARHCDVIGYDRYSNEFTETVFADGQAGQPALRLAGLPGLSAKTSDRLLRLMKESGKPVFCGEFSFPAWYDGQRGFGRYGTWAKDDAASGESCKQWTEAAAANPYCVGVAWFQYRDQPLTGRGPGRGSRLVYGEHFAFGMVDVTDRPKWDLVERVREANLTAARRRLSAMENNREELK